MLYIELEVAKYTACWSRCILWHVHINNTSTAATSGTFSLSRRHQLPRRPHGDARGRHVALVIWLFGILGEHLHSLQFSFLAQLCSRDFLPGLFTHTQLQALSNTQSSGGPPTLWPSVQSLTTFPQDSRLHPPQTHNVMLCWIQLIILVLHNYRNCVLVSISHSFSCHTSVLLQNAMPVIRHWLVNTVCITIYILLYKTGVLPTLAAGFFIGHCWATDGSAVGVDTPAVSSVAVALNL